MIKQVLYIIFFIWVCSIKAQTATPIDTTHLAAPTTQTVEPTSTITTTVQATISTDTIQTDTIQTTTTQTIRTTPTQTVQPIATQTITVPKHYKKPKRYKQSFKEENKEIANLYRLSRDKKIDFDKKTEIILQNKRYRIYSNYLSAGGGKCYNSGWKEYDLCIGFDYNFHVRKRYFQAGGNLIGPALWNNSCLQFHAGWGYRFERCNYQLAAYGGISYSDGYFLQGTADSLYKVKFSAVGVYAALQCYYKLKFDYGIGFGAFFDANKAQTLTGVKIDLFFSGAYRGNKKIDWKKEDEKY